MTNGNGTTTGKGKLFFGGLPTDPDIKMLREAFPDDTLDGRVIPYREVGEIIKEPVGSARFRTVTARWRKVVERESGLVVGVEPTVGFKVLDDKGKLALSAQKLRTVKTAGLRSMALTAMVDVKVLSEGERRTYDHQRQTQAKLASVRLTAPKSALPSMDNI